MQIQNTPSFTGFSKYKLPTREVLECATNLITPETLKSPKPMLNMFKDLYHLSPREANDVITVPMGFELYTVATGKMITRNNPKVSEIVKKIQTYPKSEQIQKIKDYSNKVGKYIDIIINDKIRAY